MIPCNWAQLYTGYNIGLVYIAKKMQPSFQLLFINSLLSYHQLKNRSILFRMIQEYGSKYYKEMPIKQISICHSISTCLYRSLLKNWRVTIISWWKFIQMNYTTRELYTYHTRVVLKKPILVHLVQRINVNYCISLLSVFCHVLSSVAYMIIFY